MKNQQLGDYLLWEGELSKIVGMTDRLVVIIEKVGAKECSACGVKDQIHVVVDSPMFKNGATPVNTISI